MIILVIAAHPDDETCASGRQTKYATEAHSVYIVMTKRRWIGRRTARL